MKTKIFLTIATAAVLTLGGLTVAKLNAAPDSGRPFGRGQILQRVVSELQLTDEQIAKIKAELRSEKEAIVPLLQKLHETRKDLRETIQSGGNETTVRAAHVKVAAVEADLTVVRARLHGKIAPILTDEQIAKAKAFEQKMDDFVIQVIKTIGERLGNG